ncbi:MAG: hypothetical protein ACOCUF_02575 [Patescibacteria group bacterium]
MKTLKTIALIIIFTILLLVNSFFILAKGFDKTFLQVDYYENLIKEKKLVPVLTNVFLQDLQKEMEKFSASGLAKGDKEQAREVLVESFHSTMDEKWIENNFLMVIEDVLAYAKGEKEQLTAVMDLKERKELFIEKIGEQASQEMYEENKQLEQAFEDQQGIKIKNQLQEQAEKEMEADFLEEIPDQIVLAEVLEEQENSKKIKNDIAKFQQAYKYFDIVFYAAFILLAGLIIAVTGISRGLKWVGVSAACSGMVVLLASFILRQVSPLLISSSSLSSEVISAETLVNPFFSMVYPLSLIFIGGGVLFFIAGIISSRFLKSQNENVVEQKSEKK